MAHIKVHRHSGKYKTHTPSGRIKYKRMPKHKHRLSKRHRKIFQQLDKEDEEYGGYMDFDDKGLERADLYTGKSGYVEIEVTPDKEIDYHTHPRSRDKKVDKINSFPSKTDVLSSDEIPTQVSLIFHRGDVTLAKKERNFHPTNKALNKIERGLDKDSDKMSEAQLFKKYRKNYKDMGLDVKRIKHKGAINLPITAIEPEGD